MVAGTVSAKTDRLEGIVDFTEQEVRCLVLVWAEVRVMTPGLLTPAGGGAARSSSLISVEILMVAAVLGPGRTPHRLPL